ncbi:hypothetical protein [Halomonas sp. TG39a]|uniref:hypothetical protein n=1 Tax=Halomonas sp. TG39a TaxID=1415755 RepID=UPI000A8FD5AE|nr:hypothetical protein [Halomonas sp. TG39a]
MSTNESVIVFMRFVKEKHRELCESLDRLVNSLVGENASQKAKISEETLKTAQDLQSTISKSDRPDWLSGLIQGLNHFHNKSWNQQHLIKHLIDNLSKIKEHRWQFENSNEKPFDFDSIYEYYKSESRLPELFDEIISILEEIQSSGEIDSLTMMKSLGKVISTLKQNRDGSYFSLNSAWDFLVSFLKNYMWNELSRLPVLGASMEALEKTIKETNEEMFKVHSAIEKEMKTVVESEIKGLKGKSDFSFVSYDRTGLTLNDNKEFKEIDHKV